jgi:uncharacterized RDD family membrane protein YckC
MNAFKRGLIPFVLKSVSVKSFHTSAVLENRIFRGLKRLIGKSSTSIPSDHVSSRLTLFNQSSLPPEYRVPVPANPLARISAGVVDLSISIAAGYSASVGIDWYTSGLSELSEYAGHGVGVAMWMLRDTLGDEGNRSIGKRMFKVEIVYVDGTPVSQQHALLRNWYFLGLPLIVFHPFVNLLAQGFLVWDLSSVLLTQDARKAMDYAFGMRVVDELPNRLERLKQQEIDFEILQIEEEIERLSPGLLAAKGKSSSSTDERDGEKKGEDGALDRTKKKNWFQSVLQQVEGGRPSSVATPPPATANTPEMPPIPSIDDLPDFLRAEQKARASRELLAHKPKKTNL